MSGTSLSHGPALGLTKDGKSNFAWVSDVILKTDEESSVLSVGCTMNNCTVYTSGGI